MNAQVGERYRCSDANSGCEIEVTSPGRMQNESYGIGSLDSNSQSRSSNQKPIGGSATEETGVGSLRNAESAGISTPGDFGSQGATGEGVFGTSGGNQRSTASGRLGSIKSTSLKSDCSVQALPTLKRDRLSNHISIARADSQCKKRNPAVQQECKIRRPQKENSTQNEKGEPARLSIL
jgi:hypothetical protein